jgi:RNA polymerase sigma factor (sigma-70 family)
LKRGIRYAGSAMPDDRALRASPTGDEPTLVRRVAEGDRAAFEILMRRYNRRLYRLARAALRDSTEAEDALQDAYICAFRSMAQFRHDASLSTWLSRLVLNECMGRLRRSARRQKVIPMLRPGSDVDAGERVADEADPPERLVARTQMRALLEDKVDALPETFRLVFVLRSVEELSVEECAQALGIPEATVRTRMFRARSLLRESLARDVDLAERDLFDFGGAHCDGIIAGVIARLERKDSDSQDERPHP